MGKEGREEERQAGGGGTEHSGAVEREPLDPSPVTRHASPRRVLFVFLDGVGLGEDAEHNPLAVLSLPALERLAGGQRWLRPSEAVGQPEHVFRAVDARLGVEGLPQSGTGQATLFTGVNAARLAGRHYGPYPHSKTRSALAERNVFRRVLRLGLPAGEPAAFANAYPPRFFTYARQRDRWTVTTRCCLDAGIEIRGREALEAGRALAADLSCQTWQDRLGLDVRVITEAEAGARLVRLSRPHAFTLFEYYLTDKAGHSRRVDRAEAVLRALDRFFANLLTHLDPERDLLLVTSDHGNLEDLTTKSHTLNPVPLIAWGRGAHFFRDVRSLTDVTPAVIEALGKGRGAE